MISFPFWLWCYGGHIELGLTIEVVEMLADIYILNIIYDLNLCSTYTRACIMKQWPIYSYPRASEIAVSMQN